MTNREKCFYSGIIGIIAMIATLYVRISPDDNIDSVKDYIVALLTFMAVTLLTYLIINRLQMRFHLSKWLQGAFLGALTIGEVVLLWGLLRDDDGYLGADVQGFFWHVLPSGLVFLLFVVITIIVVFIYLKALTYTFVGVGLKIYFFVMAFLYACTVVFVNVFAADVHHVNAFLHPIYSVFYNTPYSATSYGIYGHYELFYKVPMLIFGTSPVVICVVLIIAAMLCALSVDYVICTVTKSNVIRILSALVLLVPTGAMFQSSSYQTSPHRVFFPLMIMAYACYLNNKMGLPWVPKIREYLIGHLICSAAVLSNTEMGFVTIAAWTFICYIWLLETKDSFVLETIKYVFVAVVAGAMDVLVALGVVNVYNLAVGGGVYIKEFFSTFTNDSFLQHYTVTIQFRNVPYIYIMIAGVAAIIFAFSKTKVFQKECDQKNAAVIGMVGVLTIGSLTYYATRAVYYGILIAVPFTIVLCAFFADSLSSTMISVRKKNYLGLYESCRMAIGFFCIGILGIFAFMGTTLTSCFASAYTSGKYSCATLKDDAYLIAQEIPEDTYAFGWGTDELYGLLGWNTNCHLLGTTDVLIDPEANENAYNQLVEEVNSKEAVLINGENYRVRQILNNEYELAKELIFQNMSFGYFERNTYETKKELDMSLLNEDVITGVQLEYCVNASGYYSMLLSSPEIDLSGYHNVAIQSNETGEIYLIDTNEVSYVDGSNKSVRLYAKVNENELNVENSTYQILLLDNNKEVLYTTGLSF